MALNGKKTINVTVQAPTRLELINMGMPAGATLCGFVVNLVASDEYLVMSIERADMVERAWAQTPELAERFPNPKAAKAAIEGYEKGPVEICALFDHKKQLLVWPMPDEAFE